MAKYKIYFDESGTNFDAKYIYVAGCMMGKNDWLKLSDNWENILIEFDIKRFRASDCEAAKGQFKDWDRNKRNNIFKRLVSEINKHEFVISRVSINKSLFQDVAFHFPRVTVNLYEFCVMWCVKICGMLQSIHKKEGTVSLLFEQGQDVRPHVRNWIDGMKKRKDYSIENILFQFKENLIPYQVADLIAWEYHRYTNNFLSDSNKPIRPSLNALIQNPERFTSKDYDHSCRRDLVLEFQLLNELSPEGFNLP